MELKTCERSEPKEKLAGFQGERSEPEKILNICSDFALESLIFFDST